VEKRTDEESSEKGDDVGSGSVGGGDFEGMNVPTPAPGQAQAQAQAQTQVKVDQGQAQKKNKVSIIEIGRR
jgi:hypothetical protein